MQSSGWNVGLLVFGDRILAFSVVGQPPNWRRLLLGRWRYAILVLSAVLAENDLVWPPVGWALPNFRSLGPGGCRRRTRLKGVRFVERKTCVLYANANV